MGITYIAVHVEVSCLLKLTLSTNSGSHTSQFGSGSHILYCSRIRKKVIENKEQTEKAIIEATQIPMDRRVEQANITEL